MESEETKLAPVQARTRRNLIAFFAFMIIVVAIVVAFGRPTSSPPSPIEPEVVAVNDRLPQDETGAPMALPLEPAPSTPDRGETDAGPETTLEATVPGGLPTELVQAKQSTPNRVVKMRCSLENERCTLRLTPGAWKLAVIQEGKPTSERDFMVVEGPNRVTLERTSTSTIVVHVLDETGVVTGASVMREDENESDFPGLPKNLFDHHTTKSLVGKSDAHGEVQLSLVTGDRAKIHAVAAGFLDSRVVEVRSTDSAITLTLTRVPTMRGRIVRDDGAAVRVFSIDGTPFDASDGRFAVKSALTAQKGTQTLTITSPGLVKITRVVKLAGVDVDIGDIVLLRGQTIRGRVLDAHTSQPLSGATVFGTGTTSTVTNALGQFELDEQPGTGEVVAHASEHAAASASWSDAAKADVIVRLGRGVSVAGHAANPGLAKYVIAIGPSVEVAKLDDSNDFRFDTLSPGHWAFTLTHFDVMEHVAQGLPLERQSHFARALLNHGFKTPLDLGQTAVTNLEVR